MHIPAAALLMGTPERDLSRLAQRYGGTRESYREEAPQHTLALPACALARTPVTNALYAQYVVATGARAPLPWHGSQPPAELADHPVMDVTWYEAQDFCEWLSSTVSEPLELEQASSEAAAEDSSPPPPSISAPRFRLPSEAEWEHGARGTDGRQFPWGDVFSPECANTSEASINRSTPVGHYPTGASPYGLLDMAGNIWEWTASLDKLYPYSPHDGREQPEADGRRIARGGCYANPQGFARCACRFRFGTAVRSPFLGFRLALHYPQQIQS
jgi:formylglycine-generating enzyme required for sulfatase activity